MTKGKKYFLSAALPALGEAGLLWEGQAGCGGPVVVVVWVCTPLLYRRKQNFSLQRAEAGMDTTRMWAEGRRTQGQGGRLEGEILGGILATKGDFRKYRILWSV